MFINFYSLVPLFSIFQFIIIFHSTSAKNLLKEKKNLLSPKENLKTLNTVKDDQSLISVKRIPYDEVFVHSKIFQMAAAAYGSVDDFVKCLSTLSGSYDVYFNIQIPCFTNENCTGFMALSLADKALILSFGTSKYAYKKLLNDSGESIFSKRRKSPLGFGSGLVSDNLFSIFYQMQLAGITKKTYDMIKFFDGYDLWITGHSIGGAIASIAAAKIASANVIDARQVKLVTFGQPRVGNKAWAAAMENALPYYTYLIVNERDPVDDLPHHSFMYYTHFGLEILYFANNSTTNSTSILENYKVCTSGEDKHCKNNNTNFNINDHINYYGTNVAEYGRNGCKKL